MKIIEAGIERLIFFSRWLLAPIYLGMIAAQTLYTWKFLEGLWHLGGAAFTGTSEAEFLGLVLGLVDFLMVANLIVMVVIGGYATFVSKLDLADHIDRPAWLDHIDPGTLKTKLAGALIGISGIHLLQTFTQIGTHIQKGLPGPDNWLIAWQVIIHLTFVISTIILAWSDLVLERKIALAHKEGIEDKPA